jgi:hypothetical protein
MASRKEQKEQLRKEREAREAAAKAAQRRKRLVGYGAGGAFGLVAVIVLVVVLAGSGGGDGSSDPDKGVLPDGGSVPDQEETDVAKAAKAAGCELKSFRATTREHTQDLAEQIGYSSSPPTSGKHYVEPAEDGAYDEAPDVKQLVHTMEHGRVIIWVKPSLPEKQRADLRALVDDDPYQMVLVPRRNMPYAVAATAWNGEPGPGGTGRMLLCNEVNGETFDALQAFRDEHRSKGPEPIP